LIDDLSNLENHPIFVSSMTLDTYVNPPFQFAQEVFGDNYNANMKFVEKDFNHLVPTDLPTDVLAEGDCANGASYVPVNCGYDLAGDMLSHMLPNIVGSEITELAAKDTDWKNKGELRQFN
jgi:hypothetical protein